MSIQKDYSEEMYSTRIKDMTVKLIKLALFLLVILNIIKMFIIRFVSLT